MVKIALLVVMLLMIGCSKENNWPYPLTPFFAECEYEGKVFVDYEYLKRKSAGGCKNDEPFKYYPRGEPNLTND
ncbi:MAG: hypothetical protein HOJ35_01175 [Bdellovibrionales bacterium]|jgi:hypothetical protein|nr:hypothetical protein [Bdellovibrionales bacterium]